MTNQQDDLAGSGASIEPFVHLDEYPFVICTSCRVGIIASEVTNHLKSKHRQVNRKERERINAAVVTMDGVAKDQAGLRGWTLPPPPIRPIAYIQPAKKNGLGCRRCQYVVGDRAQMKKHYRVAHDLTNGPKRTGSARRGTQQEQEDAVPWRVGVRCQRFCHWGYGNRWFEVGQDDEGEDENTAADLDRMYEEDMRALAATEAREAREREAREAREAREVREIREASNNIRRRDWAHHRGGINTDHMPEVILPKRPGERTTRRNIRYSVDIVEGTGRERMPNLMGFGRDMRWESISGASVSVNREGEDEEVVERACQIVRQWTGAHGEGKVIVYGGTIRRVQMVSDRLGCVGYWRGVGNLAEKARRMVEWMSSSGGESGWITATDESVLGIDDGNVGLVVHVGMPRTLETFAQESGQGGRGGQKSESVVVIGQAWLEQQVERRWEQQRQGKEDERGWEWDAVEFVEGNCCRRQVLDQKMDGNIDRVGCVDEEEMCDICEARQMEREIADRRDVMGIVDIDEGSGAGIEAAQDYRRGLAIIALSFFGEKAGSLQSGGSTPHSENGGGGYLGLGLGIVENLFCEKAEILTNERRASGLHFKQGQGLAKRKERVRMNEGRKRFMYRDERVGGGG